MPPEPSHDAAIVLLVDDIESARIVGERRLRQAGYRVISVANVSAALTVLRAFPIAACVTDRDLDTGGDGLTLLETVGRWWPAVFRVLWCALPSDCELAAERGITCVEKGEEYPVLLGVLAMGLGGTPRGAA